MHADGCMPFFFDMWTPAVGNTDPAFIADSSAFPPLKQLLPMCEAIVHLGSSSVTAAALAAGVPQIACPITPDQQALVSMLLHLSCVLHWKCSSSSVTTAVVAFGMHCTSCLIQC